MSIDIIYLEIKLTSTSKCVDEKRKCVLCRRVEKGEGNKGSRGREMRKVELKRGR